MLRNLKADLPTKSIKDFCTFVFLFLFFSFPAFGQASLLPNAKQTFLDNNGNPLTSGKIYFYIPSTTTLKTTWQNSGKTVVNTNPVTLDAAGRAIIYGDGSYRQIVRDSLGNLIWDAVTSSTGTSSGSTSTGDGDLVGTVKPWAGLVAPNQYAFAYGQEVSRTTYSVLFTAITLSQVATCTSGNPILTGLSDTSQIPNGSVIESICATAGSTVISKTSTTVTLNNNAPVTTSNTAATFFLYGNGNGSTTFNLPDLRGNTIAGRSNMGGTASTNLTSTYFGANPQATGAIGGLQTSTLLSANLPPYTPAGTNAVVTGTLSGTIGAVVTDPGHTHGVAFLASIGDGGGPPNNGLRTGSGTTVTSNSATTGISATVNLATGVFTGSAPAFTGTAQGGTTTPFANIQPTITLNYIIKITPDTNSSSASGVTLLGGMTGDIACGTGLLCTGNIVSVSVPTNVRTVLNTDVTYFVRSADGNDSFCTGLTDAAYVSGAYPQNCAFRTETKASTVVVYSLDYNSHNVTVNLAGTFTAGFACSSPLIGGGTLTLTSATSATITTTSANAIAANSCSFTVNGNITISTITSGVGIIAYGDGAITMGAGLTIGATATGGIQAGWLASPAGLFGSGGVIRITGNYTWSAIGAGAGLYHWHVPVPDGAVYVTGGITINITNTPAPSAFFAGITGGFMFIPSTVSFTGTGAIGIRYLIHNNGALFNQNGSRTFLPGSTAGSVASGGNYIISDSNVDVGVVNLIGTNTVAPSTPASGLTQGWFDSSDKRWHDKNDAGIIGTTIVANDCFPTGFVATISVAGVITCSLSINALAITGTAGAGFEAFVGQSVKPSTPGANVLRLYGDATGNLSWVKADSFARVFSSTLTADRTYVVPDVSGTFAISATSPIVVNATTGNITCTTCLTTSSTIPLTIGTTTIASGTTTRILYDNAGVLGEYTITGTGTIVAMAASPALTGTPTAPTAAVDTNTTQLATTAFVLAQAASANPLIDGTAAPGTSTRYARGDHVHPTDTTRAALASPTFTGTPAAPTAAVDTNTTQLATTAFVLAQAASQADMEATSSITKTATPSNLKYHPGVAKAVVYFTISGGAIASTPVSYGMAGTPVTYNAAGTYTLNYGVTFSGANNYAVVCTVTNSALNNIVMESGTRNATSTQILNIARTTGVAQDPPSIGCSIFGDL